jgi:hypothetical protein
VIPADANEPNPYAPPRTSAEAGVHAVPAPVDRVMVKKFRDQILALGVLWIIIGTLAAGLGVFGLGRTSDAPVLLSIVVILGLAWIVIGVLACLKHMWAVYAGLVLSYLSLVGQLVNLNLNLGLLVVILVIFQAHRVIGWAKQMRAAGIPLTAKP